MRRVDYVRLQQSPVYRGGAGPLYSSDVRGNEPAARSAAPRKRDHLCAAAASDDGEREGAQASACDANGRSRDRSRRSAFRCSASERCSGSGAWESRDVEPHCSVKATAHRDTPALAARVACRRPSGWIASRAQTADRCPGERAGKARFSYFILLSE